MALGAVVLAAVLAGPADGAAPPPPPRETWAALLGSGLFTLQDTSTLARGRLSFALTIDNRDRDPLGLDIVDGAVSVRAGLFRWGEAYGQAILNRSVAVPDTPVNPPPPLDQLVPPGASPVRRPYYSLYSPSPYLDDTGVIHFGAGHMGDALLGFKARALEPRGARPGLAGSFEVRFPLARNLRDLQAGAGTGGTDVRLGAVAEWLVGRWSLVASAGFLRPGRPAYDDHRIESLGGSVVVTDEPILLPYRVDVGLGLRRTLGRGLAAVGEATTLLETGRRTTSLDRARPVDLLIGFQYRHKALQMTAALRDHRNALPSMEMRPSPVAGLVDLTRVNDENLSIYLEQIGFAEAGTHLRPRSHRLLVPPPGGPPLPPGARVIPAEYRIRSEHNLGFLFVWAVSF
jgi:hypothetical protein